jgi:hypothetical protein
MWDSIKGAVSWFLARAAEPSTWVGTGVGAEVIHSWVRDPNTQNVWLHALAGVGALLGVILKEKS